MLYQIFLSPQMKRCMITYKHGMYKLTHELPNDLRHRNDLDFADERAFLRTQEKKHAGKLGNIKKVSKRHRMIA